MVIIKTFCFKTILAHFLSICLGLVFLFSGWTKLNPIIETFEFTFIDIGIANWYVAPLLARLIIGLEFFVGVLLIAGFKLRKLTLPLSAGILLFFTIYLVLQIAIAGNTGNCGCFGEDYKMTPGMAILKNVIMLVACGLVYWLCIGWSGKNDKLWLSVVGVTAALLPFIINPVEYTYSSNNLNESVNYTLDTKLLYEPSHPEKVEVPQVDFRTGKHVVAFLSLTCPHCRIAAKKFYLIKKNNPKLPIFFVLNGDRSAYQEFVDDTKATNIPYSFCLGESFINLAGVNLPRIYYLENGVVTKKVDYFELNQYRIEEWVNQK